MFFLWKNNNYENLLDNNKYDYTSEECAFCLERIDYFDKSENISLKNCQCLNCGNCFHQKCIRHYNKPTCLNCKEVL